MAKGALQRGDDSFPRENGQTGAHDGGNEDDGLGHARRLAPSTGCEHRHSTERDDRGDSPSDGREDTQGTVAPGEIDVQDISNDENN